MSLWLAGWLRAVAGSGLGGPAWWPGPGQCHSPAVIRMAKMAYSRLDGVDPLNS